jgi:ankyrin repeat protein
MRVRAAIVLLAGVLAVPAVATAAATAQDLLAAVRKGDAAAVRAALDQGVPVDAKFRYDRTALSFAADRGQADIVALLLDRGADINAKDTFYQATPLTWAAANEHVDVVKLLLARGATGADDVLSSGLRKQNGALVEAAIATSKLSADDLSAAVEEADKNGAAEIAARLRKAGAVPPPPATYKIEPEVLARYAGSYAETAGARTTLALSVADGALQASFGGPGPVRKLGAFDALTFRILDVSGLVKLIFKKEGDAVTGVTLKDGATERWFARMEAPRP